MRNFSRYQIVHKIITGLVALLLALFQYSALALEPVSIESNTPLDTPLFDGDKIEYTLIINELQYASGGIWLRVELSDGIIIERESIVSGISAETALPALPGEEVDDELEERPLSTIKHSITPGNNGFVVLADAIAPGDYIDFKAQVSGTGDIQVTVYTMDAELSLSHIRGVIAPSPTAEPPTLEVFEEEDVEPNRTINIAALIICVLLFAFIIYLLIRKLQLITLGNTKNNNIKQGAGKNDGRHGDDPHGEENKSEADYGPRENGPATIEDGITPDDSVGI